LNANISLTGFSLPITLSDETVTNEVNTGWGRVTWGYNPWGIAGTLLANGIQMSSDIGSVSITNEINTGWGSDTWGYETWGAFRTINCFPTGIQLTGNVNSVSISADGEHEVDYRNCYVCNSCVSKCRFFITSYTNRNWF
jgi:hypothetical protein